MSFSTLKKNLPSFHSVRQKSRGENSARLNFNFEVVMVNGYAGNMSRKTGGDSKNGFGDIIGLALLAAALLLFVAQLSFDTHDISGLYFPPNKSTHNWIGPLGAYLAWGVFVPLGLVAYVVPPLLAIFGAAYLLDFLGYLRERLRWSLLWSAMLIISLTGLLFIADNAGLLGKIHERIGSQNAGGWLGYASFGQTQNRNYGFSLLGSLGATIVYATLGLISLLFMTNFQLGEWIRAFVDKQSAPAEIEKKTTEKKSTEEIALERRARDLKRNGRSCRRKWNSPAPDWALICSRCRNQPCAI